MGFGIPALWLCSIGALTRMTRSVAGVGWRSVVQFGRILQLSVYSVHRLVTTRPRCLRFCTNERRIRSDFYNSALFRLEAPHHSVKGAFFVGQRDAPARLEPPEAWTHHEGM